MPSQALDDALVPDDNRYLYLTSEMYKLVCTSDEFAVWTCWRVSPSPRACAARYSA